MPNIATILKQEIVRLARKEVKGGTAAMRKSSARQRHDIAALKRQVDEISRQLAYLERQERRREEEGPAVTLEGKRFSVKGLKSHRAKLGLSAGEYASLLGVSAQTIYNWERGVARPRPEQLARLVEVRKLGKRDAMRRLED